MNHSPLFDSIKKPSAKLYISEPFRAFVTERRAYQKFIKKLVVHEKSDGHPVMVVPGFMTNEKSTINLRAFIDELGYASYDWGLGYNLADIKDEDSLLNRLDEVYAQTGEKISLIGWSLGGVFVRQMAKSRPDIVRQVITLGSPFAGIEVPNNATWIYKIVKWRKKYPEADQNWLASLPLPAPVPSTAIYSKEDGIVPWQVCMELEEDDWHQNVRVKGSHFGLGNNTTVLKIIRDRLQYSQDNWIPYPKRKLQ